MVFGFFGRKNEPPEAKEALPQEVFGVTQIGQVKWSARHPSALTRSGFLQNPIAFRAVRLITEAASHVRLILQDENMRYRAHPILQLIEQPNESQSQIAFFEALYGYYLLSGQAYVEAVSDEVTQFQSLYLLRPDRVQIACGRDGWPKAFEYRVGGQKVIYPIEDGRSAVLQIKSFHPQDDHYGLSPSLAAAGAIDVHNSAGAWSKALLDNAARPSGAIVYRGVDGAGHLSESQYSRLVDELESNHQGARNAGRPMLLEGGLDWKPMGFSPSDMEFHRTKDTAAREIALAFGVPPMLLGIPGDNTYSNYQEANRAFYRSTILPLVDRVTNALNGWLLKDDDAKLLPDLDSVPALAVERESEWRRIGNANFLTVNEKRHLLGFPSDISSDE